MYLEFEMIFRNLLFLNERIPTQSSPEKYFYFQDNYPAHDNRSKLNGLK